MFTTNFKWNRTYHFLRQVGVLWAAAPGAGVVGNPRAGGWHKAGSRVGAAYIPATAERLGRGLKSQNTVQKTLEKKWV